MKVLLIEDDPFTTFFLTDVLTAHQWLVEGADNGKTGLELASCQDYDLILLDIELPNLDGITVCQQLRDRGYQNPILLLTAQDSTAAQLAGLNAGANDYVSKPFNLDILLARMRALTRKDKPLASVVVWEKLKFDSVKGEVTCRDHPLHLTAKEYSLLELFLFNPNRIYSRRAILDRVWSSGDSPGEETVNTHLKCLRQKLKAAGSADPIETVYGLGYRLRSPRSPPVSITAASPSSPDSPPLSVSGSDAKAQAVTTKVWQQFKTQYLEQINTLVTWVEALTIETPERQAPIEQLAHKLVGSMGMFGLMELSQQAKQLEQLMQMPVLATEHIQAAQQLVASMQQAIAQAQVTQPLKVKSPFRGATDRLPIACQLLIVDDDLLLADRLRIEAIAWGIQVEIATDLTVARQMIAQTPPQIILLDLGFPGAEDGLSLMRELSQRSQHIPVVILTAKETLQERVTASHLGVVAFLKKPLPAHEVLKTITDVLAHQPQAASPDRLLIVDDDPLFLQALSSRLAATGIPVTTAAEPQAFWQVLEACRPTLLILDLEMPGFDGLDLCQVVRADPQWQHLKILFLSAHTEPEKIARAYAVGADDYISKTTPEGDLVTRILYRLGRS